MASGKKTVGYARTTGSEDASDGESLQKQVEAIRGYCIERGVELERVFTDHGIAARARSYRAGIFTLLDEIELMSIGEVVVVRIDRLIREGEIGRQILKELESARVTITSLSEDADRVKRDTRRITSSTAAALKSATTKIRALKRGKAPAGRAPYGYRRTPVPGDTTTKLEVIEEEAEVVRFIFREYMRRKSMAKVARALAERSIAAPGGKDWSRASVAWILGNEIYIGTVKFGAVKGKGEHDPIVAPVMFHKAQKLRTANRRTRRYGKETTQVVNAEAFDTEDSEALAASVFPEAGSGEFEVPQQVEPASFEDALRKLDAEYDRTQRDNKIQPGR